MKSRSHPALDGDGVPFDSLEHIPETISEPLTNFMKSMNEQQLFVGFYHNMARQAGNVKIATIDEFRDEYNGHSVFFLENYIIRAASFIENYLEEILFEITFENEDFYKKPELRLARECVEREYENGYIKGDVTYEAARVVVRNYKYKVRQLFIERLSVDIADSTPLWNSVEILFLIRNAIVHSGGIADSRSSRRMRKYEYEYWPDENELIRIPEIEVVTLVRRVERAICAIDLVLQKASDIWTRDAFGHFWIPRHKWILEKMRERYPT